MGIVRKTIDFETYQPSEESLLRMAALKDRPIDYSDIPESTPEELEEMRLMAIEKRKKQMFSLRLKTTTIDWWKSLGDGYTGIMARLLDEARKHPEWIKKCL
ncbi:MAG: BrnA antitoxin family protein [Treponema sp.]|nr:BrnA antitoxin family protein [Treponema sp.]